MVTSDDLHLSLFISIDTDAWFWPSPSPCITQNTDRPPPRYLFVRQAKHLVLQQDATYSFGACFHTCPLKDSLLFCVIFRQHSSNLVTSGRHSKSWIKIHCHFLRDWVVFLWWCCWHSCYHSFLMKTPRILTFWAILVFWICCCRWENDTRLPICFCSCCQHRQCYRQWLCDSRRTTASSSLW